MVIRHLVKICTRQNNWRKGFFMSTSLQEKGGRWEGRRRGRRSWFSHHVLSGALCVVSKTFAAA